MSDIGYSAWQRTLDGSNKAMTEKTPKLSSATEREKSFDVDAELVRLAQSGRHKAFELLVVKYQRRIAALIRALVRDDAITEELCQEAFLRAFRALPDLRAEVAFFAWLQAIARNLASGYLRSTTRNLTRAGDRTATGATDSEFDDSELGLGNLLSASPEDELAAKQLFAALDEAVSQLPKAQRDALLMREIDGLDYQSIAATMALPLNSVKSLIYRARESIALGLSDLLEPKRNRRW